MRPQPFTFYEFFAGGGMVRAGLGSGWRCLFANDFDFKKSTAYIENWGDGTLRTKDVGQLDMSEMPGKPDLVWASFPCQDLSLAGMGAGLRGDRSGTFWPMLSIIRRLKTQGRGPRVVVLENVCGAITSHGGKDFAAIADALAEGHFKFGGLVIDASAFVPQSRPRLFVIAISGGEIIPAALTANDPQDPWHPKALRAAQLQLGQAARCSWVWWTPPILERRKTLLADLIEENPNSVAWHKPEETARLLAMMSPINLKKVRVARKKGGVLFGAVYKRTRYDENGVKVQRAEVRFDGIAGCLRTSTGGSSRQVIIVVSSEKVRSRLISSRETARLMGLPESYKLPANYNEAYHLTGDGVVVPVVRYLAHNLIEPILASKNTTPNTAHEHFQALIREKMFGLESTQTKGRRKNSLA